MASLAQINIRFKADLKEFSSQFQNAQRQIVKQGEELKRIGAGISTYVTLPLFAAGTAATKYASDLEQSSQKTEVVFGKQSNNVKKFAQTTLEAYGISEGAALDMLSLYGDMGTSMGITREKAAEMSKTLVGLAGDIASFKNIGLDQAQTALNGIFSGETESLKMLGVIMTEANLQQYAYTQGINKKIQAMSQDEKVMLRYKFVLDQTKNAHGDFQKEFGSAANQTRVFTEGLKEVGVQFGAVILPYFTKAVTVINGYMKQVMATDSEQKKWIVGIAAVAAAVGPVTVVFGTFMAAVPNIIAGFKGIRTAVLAMNAAFLANPITLTVAALGAFVTAGVLMESRLGEMTNAKREFDEMTKRATSSVAGEIAETRKLIATAQNKTFSDEERTRALNKLIQKSDEHFGKLTLETIGTDKARKATEAYTKSLIQNARVKAAEEKLVEVQRRIVELEIGTSNEADPSVWQNIGARLKGGFSAYGSAAVGAFQNEAQAKNAKVVKAELESLAATLTKIIGPQKEVSDVTEDYTKSLDSLGDAANKSKKKVEDLGVIGSEKWMQAQITALEEQRSKLDVTSDAYKNLGVQLQVYQNSLSIMTGVEVGSVTWISNHITALQSKLDSINKTSEGYDELTDELKKYKELLSSATGTEVNSLKWFQDQLSELENIRDGLSDTSDKFKQVSDKINNLKTVFTVVKKVVEEKSKGPEPEQGTVGWYKYQEDELNSKMSDPKLTIEEYSRLNKELSVLNKTFDIQVNGLENLDKAADKLKFLKTVGEEVEPALNSAFSSISDGIISSFGEAENGLERFAQGVYKTVIKLIAMALSSSLASAIQGATQSGTASGPLAAFTTPTFIATAIGGIMAAFASIPKFADGGIVSGPTLGLMGEYAGAANNPEVIAPLNKLKELIQPASSDQPINVILQGGFDVSGENLRLVLNRVDKRKLRTG